MSESPSEEARISVESLVNDLRHVIGNVEEAEWPEVAKAVLDHHDPPVHEVLLTDDQVELQKWCRAVFEGLLVGDEASTRAAALKVRQYEGSVAPSTPADAEA